MTQSRLGRLWTIYRVAHRYQLRALLKPATDTDPRPRGERLRKALEDLGPVFVKLGQALSTRPDLLPADIAAELTKLQDRVPPFSSSEAMAVIERELGKPVDQLFQSFDAEPLASASVAQVHTATLKPTGPDDPGFAVVVKVLRPGIRSVIESDLRVLHTLAELIARHTDIGRRVKPREVVAEFEKIILDELDLMREGANASQLRRNWLGSPAIYHPLVFWDFTRPQVLVMERIFGISIRELDRLRAMDVDFEVLAERGVEIFFKQTFRDNFFHADMHPGNIFVDASDPARPSYQAVDFGIVGSLTPNDQRYLAENFLAFFNRDYRRIAELHLESEWIPGDTRVEEFEAAIRTVCEPIFQRPLKDISFGFFLLRLFEVARRFDYQVQPQLVLLQKTLLNIEGLGRQLYPELDLWKTAKPILEDWMRRRLGPRQAMEHLRNDLPLFSEQLPVVARRLLRQLAAGHGVDGGAQLRELKALRQELRQQRRSQLLMLVGAVAVIAALGFAATATPVGSLAQGWSAPSWLLLGAGVAAWFGALRGR